jgi:hypothetical protein
MLKTNSTTPFLNVVSVCVVNFATLWTEATEAFKSKQVSDAEYDELERIYIEFTDRVCELSTDELSPNNFMRALYNLTKDSQILTNTIYTHSVFDLLADTYVELAEINLCRNDD